MTPPTTALYTDLEPVELEGLTLLPIEGGPDAMFRHALRTMPGTYGHVILEWIAGRRRGRYWLRVTRLELERNGTLSAWGVRLKVGTLEPWRRHGRPVYHLLSGYDARRITRTLHAGEALK